MNKLDMESKDIVKDNLEYIKERFPEAVTEENGELRINPDSLIQSLSSVVIDDKKEKYELTWPGKRQSIVEGNTRTTKTLRPLKDKSVDFDKTENIYIEGDNLETLKILQESYLNKVKYIYIDPPYNTGNDFIYNDKFNKSISQELIDSGQVDENGSKLVSNNNSNGRFHSDWLSMIYPRIKLARNLLRKDGIIFISIDENELFNLKKICDEIFGENNYVTTFTVENNPKGRKNSKFVSVSCEYCLVYAKDTNSSQFIENIPKDASEMKEDENGNFVHNSGKRVLVGENFFNNVVTNNNSDKHYTAYYRKEDDSLILIKENSLNETNKELLSSGYSRYVSYRDDSFVENTYTMQKFKEMHENGELEFKDGKVYGKNMSTTIRIKNLLTNKKYDAIVDNKVVKYELDFKTTSAGTYMKELFDGKLVFSAPKNVGLLKLLLTLSKPEEDEIILDFFSGSATTAEAVMQLNANDNGKRKYIMIQVHEECDEKSDAYKAGYKTICDVGEDRIRRAAKRIKESTKADIDYGFRVYKIDESNMKDEFYMTPDKISQEQIRLFEDNIKEDRTPDDLITQVILNLGLKLDLPIEEKDMCGNKVYDVDDGELLACFDDNVSIDIIEEIAKINPRQVVFRDSSFATDQDKVNFEERLKRLSAGTKFNVL